MMNTRYPTAYARQGVSPKYAIVAFRETLTCAIYDIEKLDKPRKKVSGATIKVEVNDGLRNGTIVSTAEMFDTLVPKLKEFNIISFFGIRKHKGAPRATVVKKRGISEYQITRPQKRSKIDTKIQKTVLAPDGMSQPKSIKTVPVSTDISATPPHSDTNLVNGLSSPKLSSYDILKSEDSFSSDVTDILNQQFYASPSGSVQDLMYLQESRDVNDDADLSTLEHITPTVYPAITRLPSPIFPVPSTFSACSNSDKNLSGSSAPNESSVISIAILVPSANRLKPSSAMLASSKLDKCSTVVSASPKPTSSTSTKPAAIVPASTKSAKSLSLMPQTSRSSIPLTIKSATKPSKVVKLSSILQTSSNVADLLPTKPAKPLTVMRCKPNKLSSSFNPVKSSIVVPAPSKAVNSVVALPPTSKETRPLAYWPTDLPTFPKQTTSSTAVLPLFSKPTNELSTSSKLVKPSIAVPAPSKEVNSKARPSAYWPTDLPASPKQTTASTAVLPLYSKPNNALNITTPPTVTLHKTVSQGSHKQKKSSSRSVLEPSALSDSSKPASRPPQQTMRYSPCTGADSRYSPNQDSYRPMSRYSLNPGSYRPMSPYSPNLDSYRLMSRYSPNPDSYRPMSRYSPNPDSYRPMSRYSPNPDSDLTMSHCLPNPDSYRPRSRYSPYPQQPYYSPYSDTMELFPRLFPQQTPEYHPPTAWYRPIDLSNSIPPFPESPVWASSFEESPQLPLPPFREAENLPMWTEHQSQNENLLVTDPRFMKLKVLKILGHKIDIETIKQRIEELPEEDVKEDKSLPYIISEEILKDSLVESDQMPERFAVKLLDRIFTLEELEGRNVYGTNHETKGSLDRRKIAAIDEAVKSIFPGTYHIWQICVNSINSHIRYVLQKIPQLYKKIQVLTGHIPNINAVTIMDHILEIPNIYYE